ncbi:hypothetical protein EV644_12990 [Kribbella orskensis]|uniref:Uncharacterized protein n=1 Tax=Kribbella orskensis TaxID=2512216 RepID=A0ABY2B8N3_9ACTN|nr:MULTISPECIES: hypothetical protein [Kribbella]TCN31215.1 hypothetical protein EV642_13190 [Kribbella sp. VKM Ac-2500]TCO11721.1 hypothetical protein EV644_12990 [Kribbella orskensis]
MTWSATGSAAAAPADTGGWEVYHHPPTGDPDNWRTEIVQPYRLTTPAIRR